MLSVKPILNYYGQRTGIALHLRLGRLELAAGLTTWPEDDWWHATTHRQRQRQYRLGPVLAGFNVEEKDHAH